MVIEFFKKLSNDLINLLENEIDYNVLIDKLAKCQTNKYLRHIQIFWILDVFIFAENWLRICNEENIKKNQYIYSGIIQFNKIDASTILDLLTTANEFGLEELENAAQSQLIQNHVSWIRQKFTKVYKISFESDNFKALQKFCNDIVAKDPNIIFNSDDYVNLSESALVSLLKLDNLSMNEGEIWDQVIRWGIAQNPDFDPNPAQWSNEKFLTLTTTLKKCLPLIRYFQITGEDVMDKLYPYHQIFEPNLWKDIVSKLAAPNRTITTTILPRVISDTVLLSRDITSSSENSTYIPIQSANNATNLSDTVLLSRNIAISSVNNTSISTSTAINAIKLNLSGQNDNILEVLRKEAN